MSPDEAIDEADLREAWPALSAAERAEGLRLLPRHTAEDLFFSLSPREQGQLFLALPQSEQRSWIRSLAPDDAADLVQDLPQERDALLKTLRGGYVDQIRKGNAQLDVMARELNKKTGLDEGEALWALESWREDWALRAWRI